MSGLDQSSSPSLSESELLLEFELLFELEFELLLEFEFELLFELELLLEFELELLLEFELLFEFEFELLSEFEFELLCELHEKSVFPDAVLQSLSSAITGAARNEVAMKATVAALAKVFIGGVLPCEKQPSVTAQG